MVVVFRSRRKRAETDVFCTEIACFRQKMRGFSCFFHTLRNSGLRDGLGLSQRVLQVRMGEIIAFE